ncbi:hypothetical protein SFA35_17575 [Pseudomonas sp. HR96]|uniref:hypothetical protein n=1 Tax=Pseudomonas sp. HR96 TaxID=1027966 RepID=UPI002A764026|nr:hypothetical protein [Pseudomonas sp. HR96]WPO98438.1 hypothetical protein SFA35_17575 [Pseudomonas sp. HR96]
MKYLLLAGALLAVTGTAQAEIPFLNATCPKGVQVHADENGPITINGKEAKLKTLNDNAYEASDANITLSLTINPDGTPLVSYTGKDKTHGVCQVDVEDD